MEDKKLIPPYGKLSREKIKHTNSFKLKGLLNEVFHYAANSLNNGNKLRIGIKDLESVINEIEIRKEKNRLLRWYFGATTQQKGFCNTYK